MNPLLRGGLVALAIASALGLAVAGVLVSDSGERQLPAAVQRITPADGALVSPQADIGADLADSYTGRLMVDGEEIPEGDLRVVEPLGQLFFTPGAGQFIDRFEAGTHSVTVVYWERTKTRDDAASFTWQFRVG